MSADWSDLRPRVLSAIAMIGLGGLAVWAGGHAFAGLVVCIAGLAGWELGRMHRPGDDRRPIVIGAVTALAVVAGMGLPGFWLLPVLGGVAAGLSSLVSRDGVIFALYHGFLTLACVAMVAIRDQSMAAMAFLILVVVASDVAGYFAGRALGGPKFWPTISPKKTWSGTVAGWALAAIVGLGFAGGFGMLAVPLAVVMAFAGQMGDIAESALKRRAGIKDSSNLIPGHGGLLDRFDAMLGAALIAGAALGMGVIGRAVG